LGDDRFTGKIYYRDKTAARFPKHPMEPTVEAYLSASPDRSGNGNDLSLLACSKTLTNLFDFVMYAGAQGTATDELAPFRMLVEKVGHSVFFVRRENSPTQALAGLRGFGHTFVDACTTWDREVVGSETNQRVVKYLLGGIPCLVRFEVDAYLADDTVDEPSKTVPERAGDANSTDTLADKLSSVELSSSSATTGRSVGVDSTIRRTNTLVVPQSRIMDIKTRSIRTRNIKDCLGSQLPRLWLSQIPNLVVAYHDLGRFDPADMDLREVEEDILKWERANASNISKFVCLLRRIMHLVGEQEDGKLEVRYAGEGAAVLEVRRQGKGAGDVLSAGARRRWEDGASVGDD
jgi:hypothetical protein